MVCGFISLSAKISNLLDLAQPRCHAMTTLILKRASASRPSAEWSEDDYDALADGAVVGRIFKANAAPVGAPWMWTLAFGQHEDRTRPTATRRRAKMRWPPSRRAGGRSDNDQETNQGIARLSPPRIVGVQVMMRDDGFFSLQFGNGLKLAVIEQMGQFCDAGSIATSCQRCM
jgi:hypothetical protein